VGTVLDTLTTFEDGLAGGGFETLAAADGESLAVRWFGVGTRVRLLEMWGGNNASKCDFSVRSPDLHDNNRGLAVAHMFNPTHSGADGNPQVYLPPHVAQDYKPTDTLVVEVSGTAADDVTLTQLLLYEGPEVAEGRFLTWPAVQARMKNLVGIRVSPSPAAATSTYGTAEALNADDDRLIANTEYALLGFTTDLPFTTLVIDGPDTRNFRLSAPGHWDERLTAGWWMDLSRRFNAALIPVINANNKATTNVRAANAGGGGAPLIRLLFAELG